MQILHLSENIPYMRLNLNYSILNGENNEIIR